jgi:WD40 repeat protein/serine/threonine protein kinase/Flp pilus assembly protein TadD
MKAEEIFLAAVEKKSPGERAAYLDRACGDDTALRAEVEGLLKAHDGAGSFLEQSLLDPATMTREPPAVVEKAGAVIGPYKLLEEIGEGGFGVVFMAEQTQPVRRKVALKVVKPGMDTRQVIARFEAERQALALMDHPNIAHVLDGGETASGRPYFVMELVRGIPITGFCDQHHLSVRQRLELFAVVCQAVQHAHQKGIIHRDIKPSNVMVTLHDDKPVVKVIDFGIAKATGQQLTDKTLFTNFAQMMGTPMYMSPEQAQMSGLDIDTRTDIYSLGVLLYELLTGTTPFDRERLRQAAYDEVRRIIREEEPVRPSTRISTLGQVAHTVSANRASDPKHLKQLCRGELDWIVMKALEKDRNCRYETANGLARDVERYLKDEPVLACPPTAAYRFRKFARRHKGPLTTALVVLTALLVGTAISVWQAIRATQAEGLAEMRLEGERTARHETDDALEAEKKAKAESMRTFRNEQTSMYFHRIGRADLEWWNNNVGRADQILDECPLEYRNWEWRYLKRLCHADMVTLAGHTQPIHGLAYDPHGRRLASASLDKSVKVWDLAIGKEIRTLAGHSRMVNCVAWSPDGRFLASGSGVWDELRPGELKVWDAATGHELHNLTGPKSAIAAVAFSPDSQRLASANWDSTVRVWDLTTGREVLCIQGHQVRCVAFSPDGQRLVAGCRLGPIVEWDAASGEQQRILNGHTEDVYRVAFSPDGQRLVSGSWDKTVRVWEVTTGKSLLNHPRHTDTVWAVDFSPDGKSVASASKDGSVKLWDASTGQELATLRGHSAYVYSVAFSPGGRCLASAGWDQTVKVWDLTADPQVRGFKASARHFRSALSPDGKRIAMALQAPADPQRLVPLKIYELITGGETLTLGQCGGGFHGATFSPDGQCIASDWNQAVKVWDAQTGKEIFTLAGHGAPVTCVAFNTNSQRLASASADKTVKIWDAKTGKEMHTLTGHDDTVTSVAFSSNGQWLASASKDHTVKIWDANNGRELFTLKGHNAAVTEVVFSRLGDLLASASEDQTVRVWDSKTWHAILPLPGHSGAVTAVAFSPDGRRLASASLDGSVRLWDLATGQEALTLRRQFNHVYGIAFTPDGQRLIASGEMPGYEGFRIWETQQSIPDPQAARDAVLKVDAQNAGRLQGNLHMWLRRYDRAITAYTAAINSGLSDTHVWAERGSAHAELGQYASAAADLACVIKTKPNDPWLWLCYARAKLGAGDLDGFRHACADMCQHFDKTSDPTVAGHLLAVVTMIDQGVPADDLVRWGKQAAKARLDWHRFEGYGLYRAGQYEAAIAVLQKSAKALAPRAGDLLMLAMAEHRLDRKDDARASFDKAVEWIENSKRVVAGGGYWAWNEQVEVTQLRREAAELLGLQDTKE